MGQLTIPEFGELKAAFVDAFRKKARLEAAVARASGASLDLFALGDDLQEIIERLLRRADEGWLGALLREACVEFPDHVPLKEFYKRWQGSIYGSTGIGGKPMDHFKVLLMPGRRVLINRKVLRKSLAALSSPQGARVLVVDGDSESGKSYSVQVVGYLAEALANFRFATIDLERVARNENNKVAIEHLARAISQALVAGGEHYDKKRPADLNFTTWTDEYCNWLGFQLQPTETVWLVLDSFRKVGVEQEAYDLIAALAMRTYRELPNLRMVLLNYQDVAWLQARVIGGVDYEWIDPISPADLLAFFGQLLLDHRARQGMPVDLTDAQAKAALSAEIVAAVRAVQDKAASISTRRLEALARLTWEEASRIVDPPPAPPDDLDLIIAGIVQGPAPANGGAHAAVPPPKGP